MRNDGVAGVHGRIRSSDCVDLRTEVLAMRRFGRVSWLDLTVLFAAGVLLAIEVLQAVNEYHP